jgi:lauroyl/myristoyl acyltransferase
VRSFIARGRSRIVYWTYRALAAALQRLPEPVADGAARGVGLTLMGFRSEHRDMYARHLRRVLGRAIPRDELRRRTADAFVAYARYWVEAARLASVPPEVIEARMIVESGYEHLVEAMAEGRGVVVALAHVGSWEWGGAWLALQGYPMTTVAERLEPPELYDWFVAERAAMGLTVLPLADETRSALLKCLRHGGLVGLICDRDLAGNGIEVDFFGEATTLPAGPATLALRTGATLLTAAVYSGPGRAHTGVVNPPISLQRSGSLRQDISRVTQTVADELAALIARAPDQWHLFQPNWPADRSSTPASGRHTGRSRVGASGSRPSDAVGVGTPTGRADGEAGSG